MATNEALKCANCGSNHTANYRGCSKWKDQKLATAKRAGVMPRASVRSGTTSDRNPARLSPAQEDLGPEWNHVTRGGRVVKAKNPPAPTVPQIKPQGEESIPPPVEATRVTPNTPAPSAGPTPSNQTDQTFLGMISDLSQGLPLPVLATLTSQLVANFGSLPTGSDRPRAVLNHVISFIAHYGCTA